MTNQDLKSKVLDRLKKQEVKVKPKWQFTLKNAAYWTSFGIATLLGAIAMSLVIFKLLNNDWDVYKLAGYTLPSFFFRTLPYLWILIFATFSFLSYNNFRHTKGGYKQPMAIVILASLLVSMVLGFLIYLFNGAQYLDQQALNRFKFYQSIEFKHRQELWSNPDNGLIAGEVIELEEGSFKLEDFKGNTWTIIIEDIEGGPERKAKVGDQLAITGEKLNNYEFEAQAIRPWKGSFIKNKQQKPPKAGENFPKSNLKNPEFQKKLKENES